MFNGIIYNQGIIKKIFKRPKGINIFVKSNLKVSKKDIGLSVACDGVCLTLISYKSQLMEFYLSKETIIRSKFKYIKNKDIINLNIPFSFIIAFAMAFLICFLFKNTYYILDKLQK